MFFLNHCGIVCAAGSTHAAVRARVFDTVAPTLQVTDRWSPGRPIPLGILDPVAPLPAIDHLAPALRSRNNRVALAALAQCRPAVDAAIERYGAERVGIVIGTSTSGIAETEPALRACGAGKDGGSLPDDFCYDRQELGSVARMLAATLQTGGPAYVQSSACSSSAKALASAARLLQMGVCDAVLCGGVDTLCELTVAGFSSLELASNAQVTPFSLHRNGINIGEGAALFLMTRDRQPGGSDVALFGWGESSDGYHMSAPDPTGHGAQLAIERALQRAGIAADQVDYINLHGTGTVQNDQIEAMVVHQIFGDDVAVSSTKPLTGHALGAASALEAALCWITMQDDNPDGALPPHWWDGVRDPALPDLCLVPPGFRLQRPVQWVLSNSFAFGGSNAALLLGRA